MHAATDESPPPIDARKTLGAWASDETRLAELREVFAGETCPARRAKRLLLPCNRPVLLRTHIVYSRQPPPSSAAAIL